MELTDGGGAEAVIDFVGEGDIEDGTETCSRTAASRSVIGYGEDLNLLTIDIISREISFIGNLVGTYVDLQDLMTLTAQGRVTCTTSTYPLDAINDAMADLDGGRLQGRVILVPTSNPVRWVILRGAVCRTPYSTYPYCRRRGTRRAAAGAAALSGHACPRPLPSPPPPARRSGSSCSPTCSTAPPAG